MPCHAMPCYCEVPPALAPPGPTRLYLFPPGFRLPMELYMEEGSLAWESAPVCVHRSFLHTDDPGFCPCVPFPAGDLTILLERLLLECTLCTSTSSAVGLALRWRCQDSNALRTSTPQTQTQTQPVQLSLTQPNSVHRYSRGPDFPGPGVLRSQGV